MQGQNQRNSGVHACNPSLMSVTAEPTASETPAAGEAAHMTGVLHVGAPVGIGAWEAVAEGPRTRRLQRLTADVPKDLPPVRNGRAQDAHSTQHGGGDCTTLLPSSPPPPPEQSRRLGGPRHEREPTTPTTQQLRQKQSSS